MLLIPATRNPAAYIVVFVWPVLLMYMYWIIAGARFNTDVWVGALVAITVNAGIVSLPQMILDYRSRGLQEMFVASPVSQLSYMLGFALSRLLHVGPGCALVVAALLVAGTMPATSIPAVIGVILIVWIAGCAFGFVLATYITTPAQLSAVANLTGLAMVLVPPVMYPLSLIEPRWHWLALLSPSSSAAQIIGTLTSTRTESPTVSGVVCWVVLTCWLAVALGLTAYRTRWTQK